MAIYHIQKFRPPKFFWPVFSKKLKFWRSSDGKSSNFKSCHRREFRKAEIFAVVDDRPFNRAT